MGTTYSLPDHETRARLQRVCEKWHPHLRDCGAKIELLMAYSSKGDPLKSGGYPAIATVQVVSLRDRMFVDHDALIQIDSERWEDLDESERDAVLDHELSHLLVKGAKYRKEVVEATGEEREWLEYDRDDIGRPVLKLQPGDWHGGDGFVEVIRRHGESAVELLNAKRVWRLVEQAAHGEPVEV